MKIPSITNSTLDNIKKDAKKIKKSLGVTHKEALDIAAKNRGFVSFNYVRKNTQGKIMSNMLKIQLSDSVVDKERQSGYDGSIISGSTYPYNSKGVVYINKLLIHAVTIEDNSILFHSMQGEIFYQAHLEFSKDGMGEYNRIKRELIG